LEHRLLGISLASFSSGLGELTFLQLSTRYPSTGVSYFASGTGGAGVAGAGAWWFLRRLGVKEGVGISSVSHLGIRTGTYKLISHEQLKILPLVIPLTYAFLLPHPPTKKSLGASMDSATYAALPTEEIIPETESDDAAYEADASNAHPPLTFAEKWELVKPLLLKFMLPLCKSSSASLRL